MTPPAASQNYPISSQCEQPLIVRGPSFVCDLRRSQHCQNFPIGFITTMAEKELTLGKIGRTLEDMVCNHIVKDAQGREIRYFKYEDQVIPPFGELAISKVKDTEVRDDDLFLAGYPKTGSTWTFEVMAMILQQKAEYGSIGKPLGFLELCNPELVKVQPSPRILNSHVLFDDLPDQVKSKKTKIVLTVRNPKDTLVSYYHFHKSKYAGFGYDGKLEDFFNLFMDGQVAYGCYLDYCVQWDKSIQQNKDHPFLVVSYEDMKEDLPREIQRLAKFLEVEVDDDLVEKIAAATGFEKMANIGAFAHVVRKGEVGDWKNWLTVAQNEIMDAAIAEKLADLTIFKPRYTLS